MNDFRQIKFGGKLLQVEEFNWMHEICIGFIRKNIEESTANHIVVVTHHLPTLQVALFRTDPLWCAATTWSVGK